MECGGNVIHFLSKLEKLDYKESIEALAERANIVLPVSNEPEDGAKQLLKEKVYEINSIIAEFYHENLYKPTSKEAQNYIKQRKLDNKTLKAFKIGYSMNYNETYNFLINKGFKENEILASCLVNKNENGGFVDKFRKRVMFPILDTRNRVIAFGGRVLDDSKPKYINSSESIVYSKGRNLYGMNVAKNSNEKQLIIVEGYMDAISLFQRGITNVVASLGTALTEAQGRLLRKYAEKVIIGYDSDGAGQAATLRGLEILKKLGLDIRILQIEGAKDPDEYVIKYGSGRFLKAVEESISLVEFKVKLLKQTLNLEIVNDKIKFLNEIAKILCLVDNKMEKEVYIDKISTDYKISKEALYAEVNKLNGSSKTNTKILEKNKIIHKQIQSEVISSTILKLENTIILLLLNNPEETYNKIKEVILPKDIQSEENKQIIKKMYDEFERGNININTIINEFNENEKVISRITQIMSEDYEITETDKIISNVISVYSKEKLLNRKKQILELLSIGEESKENVEKLEKELTEIITKLKMIK